MKVLDDGKALQFTKGELRALLTYASKDLTRPNLSGISLCPARGLVFAVDGLRALKREGAKFTGRDLVVDSAPIREAIKIAKSDTPMVLRCGKQQAELCVGASSFAVEYLKIGKDLAVPPPIEKVFTKRRPYSSEVSVNADLLAESLAVAKLISGGGGYPIVTLSADIDTLGQILVLFDAAPEWSAVVMPARGNATTATAPLVSKKKSKAAA